MSASHRGTRARWLGEKGPNVPCCRDGIWDQGGDEHREGPGAEGDWGIGDNRTHPDELEGLVLEARLDLYNHILGLYKGGEGGRMRLRNGQTRRGGGRGGVVRTRNSISPEPTRFTRLSCESEGAAEAMICLAWLGSRRGVSVELLDGGLLGDSLSSSCRRLVFFRREEEARSTNRGPRRAPRGPEAAELRPLIWQSSTAWRGLPCSLAATCASGPPRAWVDRQTARWLLAPIKSSLSRRSLSRGPSPFSPHPHNAPTTTAYHNNHARGELRTHCGRQAKRKQGRPPGGVVQALRFGGAAALLRDQEGKEACLLFIDRPFDRFPGE